MAAAYVSFAGVKLPLLTGDFSDYLERVDPIWRYNRFEHQFPDSDLLGLPIPQPIQPPQNSKIGVYWHPSIGAQSFGRASFVVNEAKLTEIRTALVTLAGGSTAGYIAAPFVLANDDGVVVTTSLLMLPPLPLLGDEAASDRLYLLTLVDKRWSWWTKAGLSGTLTSWTGLVAALETALGETITVGGSLAGLPSPSSRWSSLTNAPLPYLLDAVAHSTQRRVVVGLDGSVTLQDYASAASAAAAEVALNVSGDYRRQAGGSVTTSDLRKVVPATLRVRGAATNRDVTLSSLALSDYSGVTGRAGYTATLNIDATSLSLSQAQVLAAEWYKWQLAGFDHRTLARFCDVTPNGCFGSIEFSLSSTEHATRWYPPPLEVGYSRGGDTPSGGGSSPCAGTASSVNLLTNQCDDGYGGLTNEYVTLSISADGCVSFSEKWCEAAPSCCPVPGDPVTVDCCPDASIPRTLYATVAGRGSFPMAYTNTPDNRWTVTGNWPECAGPGNIPNGDWTIWLKCDDLNGDLIAETWRLVGNGFAIAASSISCDPLQLVFLNVPIHATGGPCASNLYTVTITP